MNLSLSCLSRLPSLLVIPALLLAAACGDDDDEATPSPINGTETPATGAPTPTEPPATATEPALTPTPQPFEGGTEPVESPAAGDVGFAMLVDVRAARHENFDRIVFEFANELPGYQVQYVEPPIREAGSGFEVEIQGDAFLDITMTPAGGFDFETGNETYEGPLELMPGLPAILEAERTGDFEAVLTWVLGLPQRLDFRVETVEDPPRIVVDVAHS